MERKQDFKKILILVIASLTLFYILFSLLVVHAFGDKTQTMVLLNLPDDLGIGWVVKIIYCTQLIATYPITIYPVNLSMEKRIFGPEELRNPKDIKTHWQMNGYRALVVAITIIISLALKD